MLTKKEALFRLLVAIVLFLLSGTQTITGSAATVCGVLGTIELATALLGYSPMIELLDRSSFFRGYARPEASSKHHL